MERYDKTDLKIWFEKMRGIEEYAHDFYEKISNDPDVEDNEIKKTFKKIAEEEKEHVAIVNKIVDTIENSL